jgi:hypothetical protein
MEPFDCGIFNNPTQLPFLCEAGRERPGLSRSVRTEASWPQGEINYSYGIYVSLALLQFSYEAMKIGSLLLRLVLMEKCWLLVAETTP